MVHNDHDRAGTRALHLLIVHLGGGTAHGPGAGGAARGLLFLAGAYLLAMLVKAAERFS
ncbi:hypothetical protein [Catenuloplanes niger]|uniref:Uncharacterized protein n=2 Tax=Catenuloplanes TaxID=33874 RepID=A0AAE3ZKY4_9ACTN|nr:hypothetical protein [Catenuloplanes niger]MDR7320601.1 hypothetical protein [Catenuloplanes niger]